MIVIVGIGNEDKASKCPKNQESIQNDSGNIVAVIQYTGMRAVQT